MGRLHRSEIAKITILGNVTIRAVASDEDPYGQGGFSSVTADFAVSDKEVAAALKRSCTEKTPIAVRCGGLEFDGVVYRYARRLLGARVVMSADSLQKKGYAEQRNPTKICEKFS